MAEVQQMLYRSPWVQQAYLEPLGLFGAGAGVGEFTGDGGFNSAPPIPSGATFSHRSVHVRWHSARPVREAFTRALMGPDGDKELTAEQRAWLDARPDDYVISVSGLSDALVDIVEIVEGLAGQARLEIKGRHAIPAAEVERVPNGSSLDLYFLFPRTAPIQPTDKQVEFVADLAGARSRSGGAIPVHARFKVKDLFYKGELAL